MDTQSALLTDFYQLSMAHGYWQNKRTDTEAVFHLFFRRHPFQGDFTISAGLTAAIDYLQNWRFTDSDISYLASLQQADGSPKFPEAFLDYLRKVTLSCDIDAMPEGTLVHPNEPMLRIKGPLIQCQLLETALLNCFNLSSLIATKAARMRMVAGSDTIAEFGLRRAQGPNGGLLASRAAYIGGTDSTSNVLAGERFGIPISGTIAHSWILSYPSELEAFYAAADLFGNETVLLVDTYNTQSGIQNAIKTAAYLAAKKQHLKAIRLDSGDLPELAKMARLMLDAAGLTDVKIIASGDLDEYRIKEYKQAQAPIDIWGIGTRLVTAFDYPALDITYKLAAIKQDGDWQYKMKITDDGSKKSIPGILQVRRYADFKKPDCLYHEPAGIDDVSPGNDLLVPIFKQGESVYNAPTTSQVREATRAGIQAWQSASAKNTNMKLDNSVLELMHALEKQNHQVGKLPDPP